MIIMEVAIGPEENADFCGEMMTRLLNPDKRWGYSTDEFGEDMKNLRPKVIKEPPSLYVRTLLMGCFAKEEREIARIEGYDTDLFSVYCHWDGDGTIVFSFNKGWVYLVNRDMKKDYGWEWCQRGSCWVDDVILDDSYYQ